MNISPDGYDEMVKKYEDGRYKVHVECNSCGMDVIAIREHSLSVGYVDNVYPPTWIERLFGATIESKLRRAKTKAHRKCDELNDHLDQCQEFCKQFKETIK